MCFLGLFYFLVFLSFSGLLLFFFNWVPLKFPLYSFFNILKKKKKALFLLFIFVFKVWVFLVLLQMWPDLIQKAKEGGLDVIQTYVFWNGHEPQPGKVMDNGSCFSFLWINVYIYGIEYLNYVHWYFLFVIVLLWGELWSGKIYQAGEASWPLCSSQDWSLCLCWVELWVILNLSEF